ncbi:MAG: hypothetical protein WA160_16880 [Pseudobdellovibrio sp.]
MSRCEIKKVNGEYFFEGTIDESFASSIAEIPVDPILKFNFKNLKSINSTGIREWIKLMQKLNKSAIELYECPKPFIDQANMVQGFVPSNARVMSFYVPYYNEDNETEKKVLLIYQQHYADGKLNPLPKVLDDSGAEMEMDVIESKYFKFIKG